MSHHYSTGAAETWNIEDFSRAVFADRLGYAIAVLLPLYDFAITIDQEVEVIWLRGGRSSLASILLVSTRWCMALGAVMNAVPSSTVQSCSRVSAVVQILLIVGYAQADVFLALRISAIWGRNWTIFGVFFVLGLPTIITNSYLAMNFNYSIYGPLCIIQATTSDRSLNILALATRIPLILTDALVLVLTWIRTYGQVVEARRAGLTEPISLYLLRDGTYYFAIIFAINIIYIVAHITSNSIVVGAPAAALLPVLVSRFMLNLRRLSPTNDGQSSGQLSSFSAVRFDASDSFFGNLGEPLEHGPFYNYGDGDAEVSELEEESGEKSVLKMEGGVDFDDATPVATACA